MKSRAAHLVLGAGGAALALLAGGAVFRSPTAAAAPQLVELRPSASCDAASMLRGAGATTVAASLRLYRLDGDAAARVLPRIRACHALRFTTPDTVAGNHERDRLHRSTDRHRVVAGSDRRRRPHPARPRQADHDRRLRRRSWRIRSSPAARASSPSTRRSRRRSAGFTGRPSHRSSAHLPTTSAWSASIRRRCCRRGMPHSGRESTLQTSDIVAGVLAAANQGPGVINLSLGAGPFASCRSSRRSRRRSARACSSSPRRGTTVDTGSPLSYPASLPHVLTVARPTSRTGSPSFSSQSRFVDLAAPGENITVATALDNSWAPEAGTSFSSPLVAGAAAWVWTVRPELDASQLFEVMRRSAVDIDAPGRDERNRLRSSQRPGRSRVSRPRCQIRSSRTTTSTSSRPARAFDNGIPPLTTKAKPSTTLVAPAGDRRGSA